MEPLWKSIFFDGDKIKINDLKQHDKPLLILDFLIIIQPIKKQ